jgi:hypothetical protein
MSVDTLKRLFGMAIGAQTMRGVTKVGKHAGGHSKRKTHRPAGSKFARRFRRLDK